MTNTVARSNYLPARTRLRKFADRAVSRALRLKPPTTDYVVHRGVAIPMRDGVRLRATHYAPITDAPLGTIVVRSPYGRSFPLSLVYAQLYAARGYHVLLQSVRGTFGSEGDFVPMVHEAPDAADTVVWLREQSWFTGTFATIGLSYLGYTQWALLADPPPELAAAVITVGPHDFHASSWGTGSFSLNDFLGWSHMMAHQHEAAPAAAGLSDARRPSPGARRPRPAAGRRRPRTARGGLSLVRVLDRASRRRRPVLGDHAHDGRAGPLRGSGAAAQRMAGPVPRSDHHPVPASA